MLVRPFLIVACLSTISFGLFACGSDVAPTPGAWSYSDFKASKNTCNYDGVISNGDGNFVIAAKGGHEYEIRPSDGSSTFTCTLSGGSLSCPNRGTTSTKLTDDATLTIQVSADADLDDADHMSGTQSGTVNCEGSGCAAAAASVGASLPCEFSVDFTASFAGDS